MSKTKIMALFYGGKLTRHLQLLARAARKEKVDLELISYNQVCFDSEEGKVKIRAKTKPLSANAASPPRFGGSMDLKEGETKTVDNYDVIFFRTTGKHWEEVDLIINSIQRDDVVVVDPLVRWGKPSYACKAWQMLELQKNGINVPKSIYGSLWYLYEYMNSRNPNTKPAPNPSLNRAGSNLLIFPVIIKGSGGDRGTRVFKADSLVELVKLVRELRKSETEEGKRYMLQEYIPNDGDYRILVLGEKVLGVMKRKSQNKSEFRNNFSTGGSVEVVDLPEHLKKLAVEATKVCGLMIAGVDVVLRDNDVQQPIIWEVNKGPQFWGFMEATKIDVPREIVRFLANIKK